MGPVRDGRRGSSGGTPYCLPNQSTPITVEAYSAGRLQSVWGFPNIHRGITEGYG